MEIYNPHHPLSDDHNALRKMTQVSGNGGKITIDNINADFEINGRGQQVEIKTNSNILRVSGINNEVTIKENLGKIFVTGINNRITIEQELGEGLVDNKGQNNSVTTIQNLSRVINNIQARGFQRSFVNEQVFTQPVQQRSVERHSESNPRNLLNPLFPGSLVNTASPRYAAQHVNNPINITSNALGSQQNGNVLPPPQVRAHQFANLTEDQTIPRYISHDPQPNTYDQFIVESPIPHRILLDIRRTTRLSP